MKLTIERLTALSPQDLIDLGKIWPHQQPEQWQSWLSDGKVLFAARFNERLLGAVKIALQDDRAELQDLLVREVTRRRGVGLYGAGCAASAAAGCPLAAVDRRHGAARTRGSR